MSPKRLPKWATPFALFLIAFFSYGVFIFQQGFHWDDWGFAWLIRTLGRPGLFDYFATNRPFLAYVYSVTTSLFGTNPVAWHLFSLLMRWLTAVSLLWVLRMVWPERQRETLLITVFFLVYPGFNQQAIAITYSHFFLAQTLLFVSVGLMLLFARQPRRLWWAGVLGVLCAAFNLFSTEYFFGLELLRPFLLWLGLRQEWPVWKPRLKRAALSYLPFFLTLLGYLYWRYFVLGFYLYQPALVSDLGVSPMERLANLPGTIWEQWRVAAWDAWGGVFQTPDIAAYGPRLTLVYIVMLVLSGFGLYNLAKRISTDDRGDWRIVLQWGGLGLVATLLAGIPFLVTDLPLRLTFPNSRFTLPFALGVSFFLVAVLTLIPGWTNRLLLACALAALWRIPDLEPGGILLSSDTPFDYSSDNSLTFPLNLIYASENHSTEIEHAYFFVSVRLGNELEALKPGLPIHQDYLAATFDSSSDRIATVHFAPPGCFRVLHPVYDQDLPLAPATGEVAVRWMEAGVPVIPRTAADALALSNPGQIISDQAGPIELPTLLGTEPEHRWCYYFEKADLARQADDWIQVAEIGDQVFSIPYYPDDFSEYLPFIEAYARTGRWQEARDLTRRTANFTPILRPALCAIWQRVELDSETYITPEQIEKMKEEIGYCPLP